MGDSDKKNWSGQDLHMFLCKDKSQIRITGLHDKRIQNYLDYLFIYFAK